MVIATMELLGGFRLVTASGAAPARLGPKAQALLGCIAAHGERGASRSRLTSVLWPDHEDEHARAALRQGLHQLRLSLGEASPMLDAEAERIVIHDVALDLREFETLARSDDPASLTEAAALYRGELLAGADETGAGFSRWLAVERERTHGIAVRVLERLAEEAATQARFDDAIEFARRLLALDPVHEGCYRALMRLQERAGLRAEALRTYDECRLALRGELGVSPSAETVRLGDRLRGTQHQIETPAADRGDVLTAGLPLYVSIGLKSDRNAAADHLMRGWQHLSQFERESNLRARAAFDLAIACRPDYVEAINLAGWTWFFDFLGGWSGPPGPSYARAMDCADRALALDPGMGAPRSLKGKLLLWAGRHDEAIAEIGKGLALTPASSWNHMHLGDATIHAGLHGEGIGKVRRAVAMETNDFGTFLVVEGLGLYLLGDLQGARASLEHALRRNPAYSFTLGLLAAVLADLGETSAAQAMGQEACRANQRFSIEFAERGQPLRRDEDRERLVRAWRLAGMPERERC